MKAIKFNIIVFALLNCSLAFAQQLPQFAQYMFNTISINPAYAGSRETLSVVGLHRSQWVGVQGAPATQTLSIHAPMRNEKVGLGLSVINDELGYENFSYIYGDFSYTINVSEKTKLGLGIKAGLTSYSLDADFQSDQSFDPLVLGVEDRWTANIGAGAYLHANKWYVGLSAPRIVNRDLNSDKDYRALERVSYYFTGGYVFNLSKTTKLKPAFLVKATNGAPLSIDLNANFLFNEKIWLGGGYRINEQTASLGGLADFQVSDQLRIGYAYEYPLSDLSPYTGGTHEVLLMFELFKAKRVKSPRYF
jgi:type IX secretion system PorP/SprF family membrane protein